MSQVSGMPLWEFPRAWVVGSLVNWMLFNVFEFSRKTFAPAEERPHVDSYSLLFRPAGAVLLTLSQVTLAVVLIGAPASQLWLAALPCAASLVYLVRCSNSMARLFRATFSAYILLFYALLAWERWHL
jgi:4-hydroxybenzoate polyprenyltransferase